MNAWVLTLGSLLGIILNLKFLLYAAENLFSVLGIYLGIIFINILIILLIVFWEKYIRKKGIQKYKHNIDSEFMSIYENIKQEQHNVLESLRKVIYKQRFKASVCCYFGIIQICLFCFCEFVLTYIKDGRLLNSEIDMFRNTNWIFMLISFILMFYFIKEEPVYSQKYVDVFKKKLIPQFIKLINPNLEYRYSEDENSKINAADIGLEYVNAKFDGGTTNRITNNDVVEGPINQEFYLKMSDIDAYTYYGSYEQFAYDASLPFNGLFTWIETHKDIKNCIRINMNDNNVIYNADEQYVRMDHQRFEEVFDVFCSDKILAVRILTADIMEDIIEFYEKYKIIFEICYKNNKVYMRFYTKNMFEPNVFEDSMDIHTLHTYYIIIKFVIEIVQKMSKMAEDIEI